VTLDVAIKRQQGEVCRTVTFLPGKQSYAKTKWLSFFGRLKQGHKWTGPRHINARCNNTQQLEGQEQQG